jgi:hypothetical protein
MSNIMRRNTRVGMILMFAILVPNMANARPSDGYHHSQDQAKITASSDRKMESGNVSNPSFKEYRGVSIGMTATEVRQKLGKPRVKDKSQDLFVLAANESVQIFYDEQEKVYAISIDFTGRNNDAPTPTDVLGEDITARADGSMYRMKHYSDAGYWVSYNRTNSDPPQVTITMQKIPNRQ